MHKGVLEYSIWQGSPSLAFLFVKVSFPVSITLFCGCDQETLPSDSPSDTLPQPLATHSVPAYKFLSLWGRQMG